MLFKFSRYFVLSTLLVITNLVLKTTLLGMYYCCQIFVGDKGSKAPRS